MDDEKIIWYVINKWFWGFRGDEDILQIAKIGLWRAKEHYDPSRGAKFSSFAIQTVKNAILSEMRYRGKPAPVLVPPQPIPQNGTFVKDFIASLSPRDAEIIQMLLDGYKQREIAEKFGISTSAISENIKKIRKEARRYFYEH